jgi:hypothetical protein
LQGARLLMSRASNTYVVISDGMPIAGFTVKYEMENWIESECCPEIVSVYRIEDVGRYPRPPKVTEITHNYYDE